MNNYYFPLRFDTETLHMLEEMKDELNKDFNSIIFKAIKYYYNDVI